MNKPINFQQRIQSQMERIRQQAGVPEAEYVLEEAEGEPLQEEAFRLLGPDGQQKTMLILWFVSGNAQALAYTHMLSCVFNPSSGILLNFTHYEVAIRGRNLHGLFEALACHRVGKIQETDQLLAEAALPEDATVVTSIQVTSTL